MGCLFRTGLISPAVQKFMTESGDNTGSSATKLTVELERNGEVQFVEVAPYLEKNPKDGC